MRYTLIAILILILPLPMLAQGVGGGLSCYGELKVSERWAVESSVMVGVARTQSDYACGSLSLGGRFLIFDSLSVYAIGTSLHAGFRGIENTEQIWQLAEGIRYDVGMFSHSLFFDQRSYRYKPSGFDVFCSRFAYEVGRSFVSAKHPQWSLAVNSQIVCNITSDVSDAAFVQRLKFGCVLSRKMMKNSSAGLSYQYMVGGKHQTYIGEAHKLHRIGLFWCFKR